LQPLLQAGNREGARAAYDAYRSQHPDRWGRTTEAETNALGYALLTAGRAEDALLILQWNQQSYPKSANTYDSVAEAHLTRGNVDDAIAWYKKALEVDPEFRNAAVALERIAARAAGRH
jgi:tetratricopeptide (TPR) repeat protein